MVEEFKAETKTNSVNRLSTWKMRFNCMYSLRLFQMTFIDAY